MILKLRIYRRHDIDLMGLVANASFDFPNEVKKCIRNYIHQSTEKIKLPVTNDFNKAVNYSVAQIHIKLSEKSDSDIIQFVQSLPNGSRNCFIKSLIRNSLEAPYAKAFTADLKFRKPHSEMPKGNEPIDADKIASDIINSRPTQRSSEPIMIKSADEVLKRSDNK